MQLCDQWARDALVESGDFEIVVSEDRPRVEDWREPYRLGLHLDRLMEVRGAIDLTRPNEALIDELHFDAELSPGGMYLALTAERFRLSSNLAATVHTRSKYARLGLECLASSDFVVPGFGTTGPAPIVLELNVRRPTSGVSRSAVYAFMLVYRLSEGDRHVNSRDYLDRFPINRFSDTWETA